MKRTAKKSIVDIRRHSRETRFKAIRTYIRAVSNVADLKDEEIQNSGFDSGEEWLEEARRLSGSQPYWRLFLIEKVK